MDQAASRYRANLAVEYRLKGMDYDSIAKELGFASRSGAWKAVDRSLRRRGHQVSALALLSTLSDLDTVKRGAIAAVEAGDVASSRTALQAIGKTVDIYNRYGKVLGIDEVTGAADSADAYLAAEGIEGEVDRDPLNVFENSKFFVFVFGAGEDRVVFVEKDGLAVHLVGARPREKQPEPAREVATPLVDRESEEYQKAFWSNW